MYKVILKFQDKVIEEFPITKDTVTIGRKSENDIRIDNLAVSGKHARIVKEGLQFFIEDLESLNGTFVHGAKITKLELLNDMEVTIGKHTLAFVEQETPSRVSVAPDSYEKTMVLDTKKHKEMIGAEEPPQQTPQEAVKPSAPAAPKAPAIPKEAPQKPAQPAAPAEVAILSVTDGKAEGTEFRITGQRTTIGKGPTASVKIKGLFAPAVAAHIYRSKEGFVLGPPDSGKMPKLNGEQVTNFTKMKDGDVLEAGGVTFRLTIKSAK